MDIEKEKNPNPTGIGIWAITPGGARLGLRLCAKLGNAAVYLPRNEKSRTDSTIPIHFYDSLSEEIQKNFGQHTAHIFIFATGIAVRLIAPLLQSKTKDPAIIVLDEKGYFAISLVSGHIGGANMMTREVSEAIGATPVITTATDLNHLPSVDLLALYKDLAIETPENIKHVNMKFIKGLDVSIFDPMELIVSEIPKPLVEEQKSGHEVFDVICTWARKKVSRETLILRPRVLSLGIGCNRNTPEEEILALIKFVFKDKNLSQLSLKSIGSSDKKNDEPGLIRAADRLGLPLIFYSNEQLNNVDTIENPSKMAEKYLGVKSVCEAAAILGARQGRLLVPKQKTKNVTLAVALMK